MHIQPNVERNEALKVLAEEGTLLVLCSLVDNMPYVLAEAAVSRAWPACMRAPHMTGISQKRGCLVLGTTAGTVAAMFSEDARLCRACPHVQHRQRAAMR